MIYLISLAVIVLDQLSKLMILDIMSTPKIIPITPFFNIILTYNTGVSFSLFSGAAAGPYVLSALALVVCGALIWWMHTEKESLTRVGLAMIIGGAIGNVIDRFLYGGVVDFLDFYALGWHWPAFNVADSAICIGAVLILYQAMKKEKKHV